MKNIRLLEDRVTRAAQRIRQLAEEKKGLESELEDLRRELAGRPAPDSNGDLWAAERADMVRSIEETLAELRAD